MLITTHLEAPSRKISNPSIFGKIRYVQKWNVGRLRGHTFLYLMKMTMFCIISSKEIIG